MRGFLAVIKKEAIHMRRDRGALRLALGIPLFQLMLFGSIDTNIKHVPTAVYDQCRCPESRALLDELVATRTFEIKRVVSSHQALRDAIIAGDVKVGLEIPPDYARHRLAGTAATFLALIDGSDNTVASQSLAAINGLALTTSLLELQARTGIQAPPVAPRPQVLFNPDTRSANLLIPGLIAILLTFSGTLLTAYAIVRERERGTLEQLMVTPVSAVGLIMGKLVPYLVLAFCQLVLVVFLMTTVFRVPINGSMLLLAVLSLIYLTSLLSIGLMISTRAKTQIEATQAAQAILLPSIMLSGYIFPLSSLPVPLRMLSYLLPATHFIAISRGIIIRGAGIGDLVSEVLALAIISTVLLTASVVLFRRSRL
ncbi:MAG TPA: ABC transporter permease [Candidatus Krumholzibacteria bacterium]|nr:ABC transporter permease [Candidatus Krumholzibacteria bacterium]